MKLMMARYPSSYSPASAAASTIELMSSGGAMPRTDSWVKRLIVAFNFAEERASSQRPENQQTLERNPSASERSSASSGPSMLSTVSSRPRALSLSASLAASNNS